MFFFYSCSLFFYACNLRSLSDNYFSRISHLCPVTSKAPTAFENNYCQLMTLFRAFTLRRLGRWKKNWYISSIARGKNKYYCSSDMAVSVILSICMYIPVKIRKQLGFCSPKLLDVFRSTFAITWRHCCGPTSECFHPYTTSTERSTILVSTAWY